MRLAIAGQQLLPGGLEQCRQLIHPLLHALTLGPRRCHNFRRVFIRAGGEQHLLAPEPVEPGHDVRADLLVGMTHMRRPVQIVDGGRNVKALRGHRVTSNDTHTRRRSSLRLHHRRRL